MKETSPGLAIVKLLPIVVLAGMMIMKFDALLAAPVATIAAVIIAKLTEKMTLKDIIDGAMESVSNILIALFILMFAYAMANSFMGTGVGAAVVNLALAAGVTGKTVAVVGIIVTSVLSVATGTSWGTFAACAPIFLWLSHIVGGDIILTTCAIAGGACFGDNIGLISDTTIVSSGIQGVEVVDRVRTQGVWSILCLLLAVICFFLAAMGMGLSSDSVDGSQVMASVPEESIEFLMDARPGAVTLLEQVRDGVNYIMVIPLLLVIGLAIAGFNTFICIGSGIVSAYLLGLVAGTTGSLTEYAQMCADSFGEAGSWVIVMMMWVAAFGGIMAKMRAFDPLANFISNIAGSVRQLMFYNGLLCIIGNAVLADEMAQIVTVGPIIKDITDEQVEANEEDMYKLKLRNATFGDAMGVFGSQLIPWHVYLAFYVGIAGGVYPLYDFQPVDFVKMNFMAMIAVVSLLVLTLTGLDKLVPKFGLPKEPNVVLKKNK